MQGQLPDGIINRGGGCSDGMAEGRIFGEIGCNIRSHGHPRRASERGHADHKIRGCFIGQGQGICQN